MIKELYQPDFSCIFDKKFANAFIYGQFDILIWPIFEDIERCINLRNQLNLKNNEGRENFYVLLTFGSRTFQLFIKIKLMKE